LVFSLFAGGNRAGAAREQEKDEGKNTKAAGCAAVQNGLFLFAALRLCEKLFRFAPPRA
jgi:hypothetical protein